MDGFGCGKNILMFPNPASCGYGGRTPLFQLERPKKGEPFLRKNLQNFKSTGRAAGNA